MHVTMTAVVAIEAITGVGEVGALMRMELETVGTLLTVSRGSKSLAVLSFRADADMGETTFVFGAASVLEVLACW